MDPLVALRRRARAVAHRAQRAVGVVFPPVHPRVEAYMEGLLPEVDDAALQEMEARAARHGFPIVGRGVGHLLHWLASGIGARRVFELGSGFGYSAWWFARAVGPEGRVICTDGDPANAGLAGEFLSQAGLWDRVEFHTGMAQEVFARTSGDFDVVYNDVDKGDYPRVWRLVRSRVRPGGLYIADNTLWYGRVALERVRESHPGWTEAIREHNRLIFDDPDFDSFIDPVRDGVLVARRR